MHKVTADWQFSTQKFLYQPFDCNGFAHDFAILLIFDFRLIFRSNVFFGSESKIWTGSIQILPDSSRFFQFFPIFFQFFSTTKFQPKLQPLKLIVSYYIEPSLDMFVLDVTYRDCPNSNQMHHALSLTNLTSSPRPPWVSEL